MQKKKYLWTICAGWMAAACFYGGTASGQDVSVQAVSPAQSALQEQRIRAALQSVGLEDTPQNRQDVRKRMAAGDGLLRAATQAGYQNRPEVRDAMEQAAQNVLVQSYLRDQLAKVAPPTEAQIRDAYATLSRQMEYRVRLIETADEATAQLMQQRLSQGWSFAGLVRRFSIGANAAGGGEMPWVTFATPVDEKELRGALPLPLAQAMVQLKVGQVWPQPIPMGTHWVLARLEARRPYSPPPLEQAAPLLRAQLWQAAREQARDALINQAAVAAPPSVPIHQGDVAR